jgi:PAS domain S-box-containing protein
MQGPVPGESDPRSFAELFFRSLSGKPNGSGIPIQGCLALLDRIDALIMGLDPGGRILFLNRKCRDLLGIDRNVPPGETSLDRFVPESHPFDPGELVRRFDPAKPDAAVDIELPILDGGGTERITRWKIEFFADRENRLAGLMGSGEDITQQYQAQKELEVRRTYFDRLFESSPAAGAITDPGGKVLRVNTEFTRLFGYLPEEAEGSSIDDLLSPEPLYEQARKLTREAALGRITRVDETVRRHKTGREVPVSVLGAPVVISGKVKAVYAIYQDITAQVRAEAELRKSEEKYRAIFEGSRDAVFIADQGARFIDVNRAAEELTGYSREELVGMRIPDLHEAMDQGAYQQFFHHIMEGHPVTTQAAILRKDGRKIETEFSNQCIVIDGIPAMHTTARDITQRKAQERALEESRDLFKTLIDAAPDIVYFKDAECRNVIVNQAYLESFQIEKSRVIDRRDEDFMPASLAENCRRSDRRVFQSGKMVVSELENLEEDGKITVFETRKSPIMARDGRVKGLIGISRDISERKKMEYELRKALGEKTVMLQEIHHRVKNNLQIVTSLLNLQMEGVEDPAVRGLFQETRSRIKSMALIHEQLYRSANLNQIDFKHYLHRLTDHLRHSHGFPDRRIKLEIQAEETFLNITAAVPCGLLINELVSNAFIHGFPGNREGRIRVILKQKSPKTYFLAVEDDGVGLPEGLDPEKTESLGLQLVKLLSRQLGGKLNWSSRGGTRFHILFKPA